MLWLKVTHLLEPFLKLIRPDTPEAAEKDFENVMSLVENARYVGEIKRPQPPWPRGI